MRLSLAAALTLCATPVFALPTSQELRDLARAGDSAGLDAAFADAFDDFATGTVSTNDLRSMVNALTVTAPAIRDGVASWRETLPDSPFAATVTAFQLYEDSFSLRGGHVAAKTNGIAITGFYDLQMQALDLGLAAYSTMPDYPPASDALLILQRSNRMLMPDYFDMVVETAMAASPERDTLWRATLQAQPQWGGGGVEEVTRLCTFYAPKVTDVPDYDVATCVTDNLTRSYFGPDMGPLVVPMLEGNPHPILDAARSNWTPANDAAAMAELRELLSDPDSTDLELAERYDMEMILQGTPQEASMASTVADNAFEATKAALRDDPYNPDLLRALFDAERADQMAPPLLTEDEVFAYSRDFVIATPLDGESWTRLADAMGYRNSDPMDVSADPLLINAIAYSRHWSGNLSNYVFAKTSALTRLEDAVSGGAARPPLDEVAERLICPMIRAQRLLEAVCANPDTFSACHQVAESGARTAEAAAPAIDAGLCAWERGAPLSEIAFAPIDVDLMALAPLP